MTEPQFQRYIRKAHEMIEADHHRFFPPGRTTAWVQDDELRGTIDRSSTFKLAWCESAWAPGTDHFVGPVFTWGNAPSLYGMPALEMFERLVKQEVWDALGLEVLLP